MNNTYTYAVMSLKDLFLNFFDKKENSDLFLENSRLKFIGTSINPEEVMLCVFDKEKLIGICCLEKYKEKCFYKRYISVDPMYQKQGIGNFLLEEQYKYAKKMGLSLIDSLYSKEGERYLKEKAKKMANYYDITIYKNEEEYDLFG